MRNLKRALSLAMASVMLLGMMVVGTGASYKDVASDKNVEAIEVLQAIGVMVGDDKGNFNPDQNVTRNEMAVVMANLMDYRVASYKGTSPFTDVPEWAEPYVAACYTNGITSGMSATTYGGDQTVTTAQAALMLMKALGYFQYQSDFDGDWQLATVKQANLIDLFVNVDSGVREAMTRNDVAQLVLNTLESGMVQADDDTIKVDTGDVTVEAGKVTYEYIASKDKYATAISSVTGYGNTSTSTVGSIVELGEKLYMGDLKKTEDTKDNFGAPSNKWVYKNNEIGTYAEDATYVFEGVTKSNAVYDAVGKTAVSDYYWDFNLNGNVGLITSGSTKNIFTQADVKDNNTKDLTGTGRGTVTYIYVDDDAVTVDGKKYDGTVTVCVVDTYAAEILQVKDNTITLDDADESDLTYDIEGYDEEDVVLYTKSYDGTNWTVESVLGLAQLVEGEATKVKEKDSVTVDGTTYKYSKTFNTSDYVAIESVDETVAFYLDQQGNIVKIADASESGDYAYVISAGYEKDTRFNTGDPSYTCFAKLVTVDGTILKVELEDDVKDETDAKKIVDKYEGAIVNYSKEDDGTYSLTVKVGEDKATAGAGSDYTVQNGVSRIALTSGSAYADKNTVYLVCENKADDDYSVYVGYNNVPNIDAKGDGAIVYSKNGIAKVVVFYDGNAAIKGGAEDVVFVVGVGAGNEKLIGEGSNKYYEFKAVVKGEATTINVKQGEAAATELLKLAKNQIGVYYGITENSKGLVTSIQTSVPKDVQVNETSKSGAMVDSFYYAGTKRQSSQGLVGFSKTSDDYAVYLAMNEDTVVATYDGSTLSSGSVNTIKTDVDDRAAVVTDDGNVIAVIILKGEMKDGSFVLG